MACELSGKKRKGKARKVFLYCPRIVAGCEGPRNREESLKKMRQEMFGRSLQERLSDRRKSREIKRGQMSSAREKGGEGYGTHTGSAAANWGGDITTRRVRG